MDQRDPVAYGRGLRLTKYQRKIFDRLAKSFGQYVPSSSLVEILYGGDPNGGPEDATMAVSALMRDLRRRLEGTELWIETTQGRGNGERRLMWREAQQQ